MTSFSLQSLLEKTTSDICECQKIGIERKIVLTGGPGAGKTAVLEIIRHSLCEHVKILPEAAGVIFGGGFPRSQSAGVLRATQRAIYHVQCGLEEAFAAQGAGVMLCDRGAVDGYAYWPGPEDFWSAVGTKRGDVLRRYYSVIHLRVPDRAHGYGHQNPLRIEDGAEAHRIDNRILEAWEGHPRRIVIDSTDNFIDKVHRTIEALRIQLPECCRDHASRAIDSIHDAVAVHSA
jgi:broad-specificity NMP kinase